MFPAEIVTRVDQLFAYADQIKQRVKDAQARAKSRPHQRHEQRRSFAGQN